MLQALKVNDWGAGRTLAAYERRLVDAAGASAAAVDISQPIVTLERRVPAEWTDYNNHMNESRYLQCFADANDALLRLIRVDSAYVAAGGTSFTGEAHIRTPREVAASTDERRWGEEGGRACISRWVAAHE